VLTVVMGPPCSGKSTYVRERSRSEDIVVDLDRLAVALSVEDRESDPHDHPRHVLVVAIAAREAAILRALRFARTDKRVWVIHSDPRPSDARLYRDNGASFVSLDPGMDVCLARAATERPPFAERFIRDWYERVEPN
jgi:hypothetical protein